MAFDRLDYTPEGVLIEDEVVEIPSPLGKVSLQHDLFLETDLVVKVGETILVKGTDYELVDYDDLWKAYTAINFLSNAGETASVTYKAIGDYVEAEDMNSKADKEDFRFPTVDEKDALAGTSGTPASDNKYVTNSDPRNSDERTPTSHNLVDTTKHPVTGLIAGHVLRASGATTYAFAQLSHGDLGSVGATDHHSNANDPSSDQKAALVGTSGTPSSTNKYVTNADSRMTNSRDPNPHNHAASEVTSGTLAVARGGTNIGSYTTNNYIRASGPTTLEQRTPAQVLSDIGGIGKVEDDTTPKLGGNLDANSKIISAAVFKGYHETIKAHGNSTGTVTLDLNDGNVHSLTQTGNITIAFSNWPASGTNGSITLIAHHDSTERTWTWPASVVWPDGEPPDMSGTDTTTILTFTTINGGTTVYGFVAGQNFGAGS